MAAAFAGHVPADAAPAPAARGISGAPTSTVALPTGDQVTVASSPGGVPSYRVVPAEGGSAGDFLSFDQGGDHYVVPAVAAPYLGTQLSLSMFDVTALARDGVTVAGRVPVDLSFAAGTTPTAPPGVTLTAVNGTSAQGYLTASSGTRLTTALRARIGADVAAGRSAGVTPLLRGLSTMRLAGGDPSTQVVQPRFPLHTLQLDALDTTGAPVASAFAELIDTNSIGSTNVRVPIVDGIGRVEVPSGNFSAFGVFMDYNSAGLPTATRFVTVTDFSVAPAAGATTTVTLDERTASSPVSVAMPVPTTTDNAQLTFYRGDATGRYMGFSDIATGAAPSFYVSPAAAARVGTLHYVVQWGAIATGSGTAQSVRYDAAFASDDIPADESFVARSDQFAAVREDFSGDPHGGGIGTLANASSDSVALATGYTLVGSLAKMPGQLTDYLGTAAGGGWAQFAATPPASAFAADPRVFRAGHSYTFEWGRGPLGASFGQHNASPAFCLACVAGSNLTVQLNMQGDTEPDHAGSVPYQSSTQLTVYQDGTPVFDRANYIGAEVTGIPDRQTTYRVVFGEDLSQVFGISQSTGSHTDLTFRYTPRPAPGTALPTQDVCLGQAADTPCRILPVLTLTYDLAGNGYNVSPVGRQVMGLQVRHLSYAGQGSHAPITSANVSVSFDGGTSWQPTALVSVDGHYVALWTNPASAAGISPELRVTATDAVGGSITQTIDNAYTIAAG